jgi:tRNA A37 threonylcarbamoyltransferase TsaD
LARACIALEEIEAVAVTQGPGLVASLLVACVTQRL